MQLSFPLDIQLYQIYITGLKLLKQPAHLCTFHNKWRTVSRTVELSKMSNHIHYCSSQGCSGNIFSRIFAQHFFTFSRKSALTKWSISRLFKILGHFRDYIFTHYTLVYQPTDYVLVLDNKLYCQLTIIRLYSFSRLFYQ